MQQDRKHLEHLLTLAGIEINGPHPWDIQIHNDRFFSRIMREPSLGAGESYMDAWWDCPSLDEFFYRITRQLTGSQLYKLRTFIAFLLKHFLSNQQSRWRSRQVADVHYDLGNDLYAAMLGETMAYTCGYWKNASTLDEAQYAKYDLICKKLSLKPKEKVLDLGCGWGGFAKYAAEKYGVEVTAVNISQQQINYARQLCKDLPVNCYITDYRNVDVYNPAKIKFDKVVSVGMCEHVGHKNYRRFMQLVRENLKETGLFLMHTIGKNNTVAFADPWMRKYIFPNGLLPSLKQLCKSCEDFFVIEDLHNFGSDYDKTLLAWHKNFIKNYPQFKTDYSTRFYRMWEYYLLSCAGAFRARSLQLWQFVMSPQGVLDGYASVR